MIYQFHSKAGPDVIMLADLSQRIFDILEHPLDKRGILVAERLPEFIAQLESAIAADAGSRNTVPDNSAESNQANPTADRLGQRAFPFLELMKQACTTNEPVVWGV
ncbi:MAG: hypothetical protein RIQ35_526 [Pseudomonadota bacterium]|jgi:hypothetical protein